jgi:NAD(P)H-nitrite reductase large subunit
VDVLTGKDARAVRGNGHMTWIEFVDGSALDILVISAEIKPRDERAPQCGLTVGVRGGGVIDDRRCTSSAREFVHPRGCHRVAQTQATSR